MEIVDPCQSKLSPEEREQNLSPLLSTGWTVQAKRDAIYKEFVFKNFNEVCYMNIAVYNYYDLVVQLSDITFQFLGLWIYVKSSFTG